MTSASRRGLFRAFIAGLFLLVREISFCMWLTPQKTDGKEAENKGGELRILSFEEVNLNPPCILSMSTKYGVLFSMVGGFSVPDYGVFFSHPPLISEYSRPYLRSFLPIRAFAYSLLSIMCFIRFLFSQIVSFRAVFLDFVWSFSPPSFSAKQDAPPSKSSPVFEKFGRKFQVYLGVTNQPHGWGLSLSLIPREHVKHHGRRFWSRLPNGFLSPI